MDGDRRYAAWRLSSRGGSDSSDAYVMFKTFDRTLTGASNELESSHRRQRCCRCRCSPSPPMFPIRRVADQQRTAMKPFARFDGVWRGQATIVQADGQTKRHVHTERVGRHARDTLKVIEGPQLQRGRLVRLNAFAVISFDRPERRRETICPRFAGSNEITANALKPDEPSSL